MRMRIRRTRMRMRIRVRMTMRMMIMRWKGRRILSYAFKSGRTRKPTSF